MTTSDEIVLKMQGIRKTFPGVVALEDVDLELRHGEVHVILGENGAGKSTLMKILSGAYQKDAGEIKLDGKTVAIRSPKHAQEMGISTIYQELNLIPYLTAGENIFLGREPVHFAGLIDRRRLYAEAQRFIDGLSVNVDARAFVGNLGVAQQQMVEVAKALSLEARILIMDEPTSSLTEAEIRELFATITRLRERGVSIIYISHRLEELLEIGDRVTVLRDGKLIATRNIAEVNKAELVRLMANRELTEHYPKEAAEIGESVLQVNKLCLRDALSDISFELRRGEILGIFGLLGSGRTELARSLFGLESITSGEIRLHGKSTSVKSPRTAIDAGMGFLTEDRKSEGLVLCLSVKDNVALPCVDRNSTFGIIDDSEERTAAERLVSELNIKTPGIDQKVTFLSGGNQQKVVLSKWLYTKAEIFIFDEPTRGIDVASKVEIYRLMNRLTASGVAIIMISSELPEILGMSDRILVMRQGRLAGKFDAANAAQEAVLGCALGEAHAN